MHNLDLPFPLRALGWAFRFSLLLVAFGVQGATNHDVLRLERAIALAIENDPGLMRSDYSQQSLAAQADAVTGLPSPQITLGMANVPTDSFDMAQEGMTQFKVTVNQKFPRGRSQTIEEKRFNLLSAQFLFQRHDRRAKIVAAVSEDWLEAYKAQESIALIKTNRALFEQLVDLAQSRYSSALGRSRQQDLIRAQLELTRLDDRLTALRLKQDLAYNRLLEWVNGPLISLHSDDGARVKNLGWPMGVDRKLPQLTVLGNIPQDLLEGEAYEPSFHDSARRTLSSSDETSLLLNHPAIKAVDQRVAASALGIKLAAQKRKPQWGVNAGYGYRKESSVGMERADFLSLGVSFDMPVFTANRQDRLVEAAIAEAGGGEAEKAQLINAMRTALRSAQVELQALSRRQALFTNQLLLQMGEQSQASLTAYTYDDGDFAEVVRSRIAELNAQIEALSIAVDRQKSIARLNYFYPARAPGALQHDVDAVNNLSGVEND